MGKKFFLKTVETKRLRNGNLVEVTKFFGKNGEQVECRVRLLPRACSHHNKKEATNDV